MRSVLERINVTLSGVNGHDTLTVLEQHVHNVKRRPADGEQKHNSDHHFDGTFLLPVRTAKQESYCNINVIRLLSPPSN